jgi:flavin-dependent dehydrogenase
LVAHYENFGDIGDWGEMHVERDVGYVGIAAVDGGLTNVAMVVPNSAARAVSADRTAFFEQWLRDRPQLAPRVASARLVTPVLATGPFASHARRAWAPGAALVGDAADFFDPFTGEGIYSALRGGELLAPFAVQSLGATNVHDADAALRNYDRARRAEFRGKWMVEKADRRSGGLRAGDELLLAHARGAQRTWLTCSLVSAATSFRRAKCCVPGYAFNLFRPNA